MIIDHNMLAKISYASYSGEQALKNLGFPQVVTFRNGNIVAYVCLSRSSRQAILVFRGSDDPKDWRMNLNFLKVKSPLNRDIHRGFQKAYKKVGKDIQEYLDSFVGWDLYLTGHSLGAALAVICAVQSGIKYRDVVTFGQPKVFGSNNHINLTKYKVVRYVNKSDIVCRIPTIGYEHSGDLLYINNKGEIRENPSNSYMRLDSFWRLFNWASDHKMKNYLAALDSKDCPYTN